MGYILVELPFLVGGNNHLYVLHIFLYQIFHSGMSIKLDNAFLKLCLQTDTLTEIKTERSSQEQPYHSTGADGLDMDENVKHFLSYHVHNRVTSYKRLTVNVFLSAFVYIN